VTNSLSFTVTTVNTKSSLSSATIAWHHFLWVSELSPAPAANVSLLTTAILNGLNWRQQEFEVNAVFHVHSASCCVTVVLVWQTAGSKFYSCSYHLVTCKYSCKFTVRKEPMLYTCKEVTKHLHRSNVNQNHIQIHLNKMFLIIKRIIC
jgi:hypothetical protein